MDGKQYIGIHLNWDYNKRELITSMQGYTEQALKELEHAMPLKPCHAPSKAERPSYGAKIQYAKEDDSPELNPKGVKFIQRTTGKFLYYGRTVDITMQHALNDIATTKDQQTRPHGLLPDCPRQATRNPARWNWRRFQAPHGQVRVSPRGSTRHCGLRQPQSLRRPQERS